MILYFFSCFWKKLKFQGKKKKWEKSNGKLKQLTLSGREALIGAWLGFGRSNFCSTQNQNKMTACLESLSLVNVRDMLKWWASLIPVAGKLVKNWRFWRIISFSTFPHSRAIETNYMDDLLSVTDRSCIKHACSKQAWADLIMPLSWNFPNKMFEFQGLQISTGDANEISG